MDEDKEWPQEWIAHVDELDESGVARIKGTAEVPVLQFDEAPRAVLFGSLKTQTFGPLASRI